MATADAANQADAVAPAHDIDANDAYVDDDFDALLGSLADVQAREDLDAEAALGEFADQVDAWPDYDAAFADPGNQDKLCEAVGAPM